MSTPPFPQFGIDYAEIMPIRWKMSIVRATRVRYDSLQVSDTPAGLPYCAVYVAAGKPNQWQGTVQIRQPAVPVPIAAPVSLRFIGSAKAAVPAADVLAGIHLYRSSQPGEQYAPLGIRDYAADAACYVPLGELLHYWPIYQVLLRRMSWQLVQFNKTQHENSNS